MSRSRFAILSFCTVLGACGEKFVATAGGNAGSAGTSSAGEAGEVGRAGSDNSAGEGGDNSAGDGGDAAGAPGASGAPSSGGSGGSGGLLGIAGSINTSGFGGALLEPVIPRAGLVVWLRADRGIVQKDGHVQTWQDQSGSQLDATQESANARPSYLSDGFNGRPTLEFDGQGQFLAFAEGFGDFSKGLSGFTVAKPTDPECAAMLELSNGSEVDDVFLGMYQGEWQYEVGTSPFRTGKVDPARFSAFAVNHRAAGSADLRVNGNLLSTVQLPVPPVPASGVRENNFVGHSLYENCAYFQGQISELILYSRALTNIERSAIDTYLNSHWALADQDAPAP